MVKRDVPNHERAKSVVKDWLEAFSLPENIFSEQVLNYLRQRIEVEIAKVHKLYGSDGSRGVKEDLEQFIIRQELDAECHTSDYILSSFILNCVQAFKMGIEGRERAHERGKRRAKDE